MQGGFYEGGNGTKEKIEENDGEKRVKMKVSL